MPKQRSDRISILAPSVLRRFLIAFLVAALVFSGIVATIYRQDVRNQQVLLEQEARQVIELQKEMLFLEFRAVQSDLLFLATQEVLVRFLSGDASVREGLEQNYMRFALAKGVYDQVRCLDPTGQEIVRVNFRDSNVEVVPKDELQTKATRYYYQQALSLDKGEIFVSPLDLNVEHDEIQQPIKPVIRFLTPVFNESGEKAGLLVLNYLGAHLLSKLKQVSEGFRGETMLLNPDGEYLQAPDPSREWGWLRDHHYSFRRDFPTAWVRGSQVEAGEFSIGEDHFTVQRVTLGHRSGVDSPSADSAVDEQDSSLVLVAYVSSMVANAHSRDLLKQLTLMYVGVMAVVGVLSLFWARAGETRRHHERCIAESESRLRQLSSTLLAAQEAERRTLSRDLHDELGQQLTAISLDLRSIEKAGSSASSNTLLRRAIEETDQLLSSLHAIAQRVRPSVLDDLGLHDAVQSYLSEYSDRTGVHVTSRLSFQRQEIPPIVGENVYRILQEALANVAEHAQVDRAKVAIETDAEALRLTVEDAGLGFDPLEQAETTRLGILGMRERAELLNGEFALESTPGVGTTVQVAIPIVTQTAETYGKKGVS